MIVSTQNTTELTDKLEKHLKRLKKTREKELEVEQAKEELTVAKIELQKAAVENKMDKIEKELSHRELFDSELREAIKQAVEKRVDASYSDLISAVDKLKKHINILDGVGNGESGPIIVIPGEIVGRYSLESPLSSHPISPNTNPTPISSNITPINNIIDTKQDGNGEFQPASGTGDNSGGQAQV